MQTTGRTHFEKALGGGLILEKGLEELRAYIVCGKEFGTSDSDIINSLIIHLLLISRD